MGSSGSKKYKELQTKITAFDKTMVGFLKAVDTTTATIQLFIKQQHDAHSTACIDQAQVSPNADPETKMDLQRLMLNLLYHIEDTVSTEKRIALDETYGLLESLRDILSKKGDQYSLADNLELDKYQSNIEEIQQICLKETRMEELLKENQRLHERWEVLEQDKKELANQLEIQRSQNIILEQEKEEKLDALEQDKKELSSQLHTLLNDITFHKNQTNSLEQEKEDTYVKANEEMGKIKAGFAEERKRQQEQILKQRQEIETLKKQYEEVNKQQALQKAQYELEKKSMTEKVTDLNGKISKLEKEVVNRKQEIYELNEKLTSCETTIKHLEAKIAYLEEVNESVKKELDNLKRKKILQIQLFYQGTGGMFEVVEDELVALLRSRMEDKYHSVEFIVCKAVGEIRPDLPVLLLCVSASRLGTDAANAIQGVKLTSRMSLLVFHHKDEHALPSQASKRVLTGQDFRNLGGIFDLAFLSGKGVYSCETNEENINNLVNFLHLDAIKQAQQDTK